ncbi:LCP family protein [Alkalihalophilus marmarensis]|uniref:LCP family protein n=1 Tax=Alkalihalophilus marmarensis TaxID=521377 RepID=UPI002DB6CC54|nr:LCP family protein [Alkalihalophilus marmarensis]MEC2071472.1 LCP family protein [Alkalihalophilus marmarensis]
MDTRRRRSDRHKRRPRKRKKLFVSFLLLFSLLFISTAAFAVFQYELGKNNAQQNLTEANDSDEMLEDETEVHEFQSKEPENNEPINVLLIGVDTAEDEPARTDTIMVAQYDPKNGDAKLASIMRDTYVEIPGYRDNKINASFFLGGPDLLRETIEHNFGLDLHYYAMVNFDGFVEVVDTIAPKGIEVDVEDRMYYQSGSTVIDFEPGTQVLDGQQALNYVRFRSDANNDFGRVERQQEMLTLLKDELLTVSGLTRVPRLIGSVEPYLDTNIKTTRMLSLGRDFILNPVDDVQTLRIPVKDGYSDQHYSHAGAVLELDFEKNKEAIHSFFSNESKGFANDSTSEDDEDM